jgi:hypothetical protein
MTLTSAYLSTRIDILKYWGRFVFSLYKCCNCCLLRLHSNLQVPVHPLWDRQLDLIKPIFFNKSLCCLIWPKMLHWHWLLIHLRYYSPPLWDIPDFPGEANPGSGEQNCQIGRILRDNCSEKQFQRTWPASVSILQLLRGTSGVQPPKTCQKDCTNEGTSPDPDESIIWDL